MKFTVVTPSYNQGRFIRDCIESVLAQSAGDPSIQVEHIIMDACSTDETLSILKRYPQLKWFSEADKGQSDAINKGVAMASGDWVVWLNIDDHLLPGTLRRIQKLILANPMRNLFYGHTLLIGENGQTIRPLYQIPYRPALTRYGLYIPPTSGTVFKTTLLRSNPLDITYHYVMDTEWFLRNGSLVRPRLVRAFTTAFRIWPGSKTGPLTMSGKVAPKHQQERERYLDRYIFASKPKWIRPLWSKFLAIGHFLLLPEYYIKKIYSLLFQKIVFRKNLYPL